MAYRHRLFVRRLARVAVLVTLCGCLTVASSRNASAQPPVVNEKESQFPPTQESTTPQGNPWQEIRDALVRLPLAAALGAALALRPRRREQGHRSVLVVQTQIMLAVVGAVIMLVVGNSLSRAFGIVGAAGLVRYRSSIDDPKEAVVMLCALAAGLAAGVGLYLLAPFATFFMASVLWLVEYFGCNRFPAKGRRRAAGARARVRIAQRVGRDGELQRVGTAGCANARCVGHAQTPCGWRRAVNRVG
jgi:hypothetical protein